MRNMSFSLTWPQIQARTKTVTRRIGWDFLKPGDHIQTVKKGMGLKKGQTVEKGPIIEIVGITQPRLYEISADDVAKEGFPGMRPEAFVEFFCAHMSCADWRRVNRIEFKYVEAQ